MNRLNPLKKWLKQNKNPLILVVIYLLGILAFSILILAVVRIPGTDDTAFLIQMEPYDTLLDWLNFRYHTWSGRFFAESFVYIFTPLPEYVWRIFEIGFYALFSGFLFLYYLLFTKKRTVFKDRVMLVTSLVSLALLDTGVILTGVVWITGSMNYFWLATIAIVALYPVLFYVLKDKKPHWWFTVIGVLATIIAASSHEQGGLILAGLFTVFSGYVLFKRFKSKSKFVLPYYLFIFAILAIISLAIGLTVPGNAARVAAETVTWRPDFYTIPIIDHIEFATRWFIDAVINHSGFLLIAIWGLFIALFGLKKNKRIIDYTFIGILSVASILSLAKGFDAVNPLLTFYASWKPDIPHHKLSLLILFPWIVGLVATVFAPLVLYGAKNNKGLLLSLLLAVFLCSILIITLSPTMYASGPRTLFFGGVVLIFILLVLFDEFIDKYSRGSAILVLLLICCVALAQF